MKKLSYLFLLVLGLGLVTSCEGDFLEEVQTTDLDKEVVFADSAYTAGFLTQIYADASFEINVSRMGGGLQTACDEAEPELNSSGSDVQWARGTVHPMTVTSDAWETCYRNIRRVNVFLLNSDNSMMAESQKVRYRAEARFLRAWYYSILLRQYGGVPLVGDMVIEDANDADLIKLPRNTYAECVEYIVNECKAAAENLPYSTIGRNVGRASQSACYALIARVKLYAASPLFNGNADFYSDLTEEKRALLGYPEYNIERWKEAADAAAAVIALNQQRVFSCHYHLGKDLREDLGWGFYGIFKASDWYQVSGWPGAENYTNGAYDESIFIARQDGGWHIESAFRPPSRNMSNGNGGHIYHDLVELFPMLDGKPVGESMYERDLMNPNVNRDPRFRNTVCWNGKIPDEDNTYNFTTHNPVCTYKGDGATVDAIYDGTTTGYYIDKMTHRFNDGFVVGTPQDRIMMRMGDLLLQYAEAVNEYYGPNHTETLAGKEWSPIEVLKVLRERAGIEAGEDGLYGLKANMSQDEMREAIRLERRLELAFEGHRFYDVRRWKIADQTDNKTMHGYEITRDKAGNMVGKVIEVSTRIFTKKMYFWPIPYNEVVKNENMVQNPYYE